MNNDSIEKLLKNLKSTLAKKENEKNHSNHSNLEAGKFVAKTAKPVVPNKVVDSKNEIINSVEKVIDSYLSNDDFLGRAIDNFFHSNEFALLIEKKLASREGKMQKILNAKIAEIFNKND